MIVPTAKDDALYFVDSPLALRAGEIKVAEVLSSVIYPNRLEDKTALTSPELGNRPRASRKYT